MTLERNGVEMSFLEHAKQRYSVRKYKDQKVEKEKLALILEAAHVAPTAANRQPVHLIVVQEETGLQSISKATNVFHAPLAIIVCADKEKAWTRPFDDKQTMDIDSSILTDHMMHQATELGIGSVWICYFKPDVVRQAFHIPEHMEPINILAMGYADEPPQDSDRHAKTRIPITELVSYESM